jgi:uncharacterized protein with HEPN domain
MKKDDSVYVGHMFDTARLILSKVAGRSRAEFDEDENLRLAVTHLIQTLGEAARRVSPQYQQSHPSVPWQKVIGMRHRVVHDYLHIDYDIVWNVATLNLPLLVTELEKIVCEGSQ